MIGAQDSHQPVSTAYLLTASQSLVLGPLLGLSQSLVLPKVTARWKWWIGASLASWLIVDAVIHLLSRGTADLDVLTGDGSLVELYLSLIATTPLTVRALLWVLAPLRGLPVLDDGRGSGAGGEAGAQDHDEGDRGEDATRRATCRSAWASPGTRKAAPEGRQDHRGDSRRQQRC
ncbi:hypothetical protein [Streptomyces sp. NPDC020817]|uniref:hypothetical protein n=1 Tax=Streptomyces sp. NPDC020817 TaxID=3365095 RepID=UPI0037BB2159